ncbi:hypothetical protein BJY52DRAFT_1272449 [Lactarius psammicola]|nr:hypothetical protein BJY52DRAFT_1272449 [Lactarius psammicola]
MIHSECRSRLCISLQVEFMDELSEEGYSVTGCLGGGIQPSEEQLDLRYQVSSRTLNVRASSHAQTPRPSTKDYSPSSTPLSSTSPFPKKTC